MITEFRNIADFGRLERTNTFMKNCSAQDAMLDVKC